MKNKIFIASVSLFILFLFAPQSASAAKSPTPRITEIAGAFTQEVRVHFQIKPIKSGEIIRVDYKLSTGKFNDVKYKIPKNAKRAGQVNAAASAAGSAIDFHNLPIDLEKFVYHVKVRIKVSGKNWSSWSNTYSF